MDNENTYSANHIGAEGPALRVGMQSAVGVQPNRDEEIGVLQERITSTRGLSITSVQAIYVPADDYTDPAPAPTFAHLDSTTSLARASTEPSLLPAVAPPAPPRPASAVGDAGVISNPI